MDLTKLYDEIELTRLIIHHMITADIHYESTFHLCLTVNDVNNDAYIFPFPISEDYVSNVYRFGKLTLPNFMWTHICEGFEYDGLRDYRGPEYNEAKLNHMRLYLKHLLEQENLQNNGR